MVMLRELDNFIEFIVNYRHDDRISLTKKMKYGFRYYYLTFHIDSKDNSFYSNYTEIIFDNRNQCIEIVNSSDNDRGGSNIIVEDKDLLDKWNLVLENIVNENIDERIKSVMESTLSSCYKKDLYRIYQMGNLIDPNEE